jgi:hypothetical protein
MRLFRRRSAALRESADGIVTHAVAHSWGGRAASIISAIGSSLAVVFSAYSLWETSLKQAELTPYVTGVVTYERDLTADENIQPSGGFEVFALPITITNGGARDAAVLSLQLDVKNPKSGLTARFEATYTVDATYFAATGAKRPKAPFSALAIAGRSAWTGTVLFYPVSYSNGKALTPVAKVARFNDGLRAKYASEMGGSSSISVLRAKNPNLPELAELDAYDAKVLTSEGKVDVALKLLTPAPSGWLDRVLGAQVAPITRTLEMPEIPEQRLRGELVRLRSAASS